MVTAQLFYEAWAQSAVAAARRRRDLFAESNNPFVPSSPVSQGRIEGRYAISCGASFTPGHGPLPRYSLDTPPKAAATRDERKDDHPRVPLRADDLIVLILAQSSEAVRAGPSCQRILVDYPNDPANLSDSARISQTRLASLGRCLLLPAPRVRAADRQCGDLRTGPAVRRLQRRR